MTYGDDEKRKHIAERYEYRQLIKKKPRIELLHMIVGKKQERWKTEIIKQELSTRDFKSFSEGGEYK